MSCSQQRALAILMFAHPNFRISYSRGKTTVIHRNSLLLDSSNCHVRHVAEMHHYCCSVHIAVTNSKALFVVLFTKQTFCRGVSRMHGHSAMQHSKDCGLATPTAARKAASKLLPQRAPRALDSRCRQHSQKRNSCITRAAEGEEKNKLEFGLVRPCC